MPIGTDSLPVAIVNEEFVQRYYKGQDVVGLHIRVAGGPREIVGVVGERARDILRPRRRRLAAHHAVRRLRAGDADARRARSSWCTPGSRRRGSCARRARSPGCPEAIRQSVAAVDPLLPIAKMESMADVQAASLAQQRFMMSVVVGLGVVALLLAAIGIHGLIASSVSERTRELGIRLALGATGRQVVTDVVMPGVVLAGVGVAIGSAASLAAVRLLQSFLWGVTPTDPLTFGLVVATLLAVALIASIVPALRVLRLDPARTLRAE